MQIIIIMISQMKAHTLIMNAWSFALKKNEEQTNEPPINANNNIKRAFAGAME